MSSKHKLLNQHGKTLTIENPDSLLGDSVMNPTVLAYTVETVDDLVDVPSGYTTAIVKDIDRGGTFIWSSTGAANGGTVFAGSSGYWVRQYSGAVNVKWFGAKGDGVTDDTAAINSAFQYSKNIIFDNAKTYKVTGSLNTIGGQSIDLNHSTILASTGTYTSIFGHSATGDDISTGKYTLFNVRYFVDGSITNGNINASNISGLCGISPSAMGSSYRVKLDKLSISNCNTAVYGALATASIAGALTGWSISNIIADGNLTGIFIDNNNDDIVITNWRGTPSSGGKFMYNGSAGFVSCHGISMGGNGGYGIQCASGANLSIDGILVESNFTYPVGFTGDNNTINIKNITLSSAFTSTYSSLFNIPTSYNSINIDIGASVNTQLNSGILSSIISQYCGGTTDRKNNFVINGRIDNLSKVMLKTDAASNTLTDNYTIISGIGTYIGQVVSGILTVYQLSTSLITTILSYNKYNRRMYSYFSSGSGTSRTYTQTVGTGFDTRTTEGVRVFVKFYSYTQGGSADVQYSQGYGAVDGSTIILTNSHLSGTVGIKLTQSSDTITCTYVFSDTFNSGSSAILNADVEITIFS